MLAVTRTISHYNCRKNMSRYLAKVFERVDTQGKINSRQKTRDGSMEYSLPATVKKEKHIHVRSASQAISRYKEKKTPHMVQNSISPPGRHAILRSAGGQSTATKTNKLKPSLTQSGSVSRTGSVPTGLIFDWILRGLLLIVSRADFMVFVLFLEAVGVREYCCKAVASRLESLYFVRAFSARNACFARDELSSKRVGGDGLSRNPPKLTSWHCTQPRAAKATASVAFGSMSSIPRAAAIVRYTPLTSGTRNAPL